MNTSWEPSGYDQGWKIKLAETIKANVGIPVFAVSVIRNPAYAEQLQELREDSAVFTNIATGKTEEYPADYFVVSVGMQPIPIPEDYTRLYPNLKVVGDAVRSGRIRHAVEAGYHAAYDLE